MASPRSTKPLTLLITGVGGIIGQEVIKSARASSLHLRVVGTDINPMSAGLYMCDVARLVPPAKAENFVEQIVDICRAEAVNAIIPCINQDLEVIAVNREKIQRESGAVVVTSSAETIQTCADKWACYLFCKKAGVPHARTVLGSDLREVKRIADECGFPLVVKPRRGVSSKGNFVANSAAELERVLPNVSEPIVQEELLPRDQEYTSGIMVGKNGVVLGVITMRRDLQFGLTYKAEVDDYPEVTAVACRLAEKLLPVGPLNIQARLTAHGPIIFDVNPRFSSSTYLRAKFGFNELEAVVRDLVLGERVEGMSYRKGIALRYWSEICFEKEPRDKLANLGRLELRDFRTF